MTRGAISRLLLVAAAASLPASLSSAPAPAAAATAEAPRLATRFVPPLNTPLRYHLIQERTAKGRINRSVMEQEVTYTANGNAYVMRLRPTRLTVGGTSIDLDNPKTPLPPSFQMLRMNVVFDLDADGAVVRVRNWEEYKQNLRSAIPLLAAAVEPDPAKRPQAEALIRKSMESMVAMSAEDAPSIAMKGWPDTLSLMGLSAPAGEAVETDATITSPLFPKPLTYNVRTTMTAPPGSGLLRIVMIAKPDPDEFRAAMMGMMDTFWPAPSTGARSRADIDAKLGATDVSIELVADFDAKNGLVRRAVLTRNASVGGETGVDRVTIEAQF